jgi:hypothetical protein
MGVLWKIPFNLADCLILVAGPGLVAVLIGTLPHAGGGRVLAANHGSGVTPPIAVESNLGTFLTTDASGSGLSLTAFAIFYLFFFFIF